jgi:aminocarboxymuconate-semialdehyde decarboxylase
VGVDRVVVGSDYPYPLGERPAGKVVRESLFLDEPERHQILRDNAEVFLGASVVPS